MAELIKVTGIVLKSSKHTAEASRLLDIFSPTAGRLSATIRGVEKPKAKLAAASQPFCFGEFILAQKNGFYTVTDCSVYDTFFELVYNLDAYVLGCSMLEATSKLVQYGEENYELFKLLLDCLKIMVYEKSEPTATAIKFFGEALNISGFGFELKHCHICGSSLNNSKQIGLIYEGTGGVCSQHINNIDCLVLSPSEWGVFKNIFNNSVDEISRIKFLSREALTSCLKLTLKQFYYRTGEKLTSLDKYFI